MLVGQIYQLLPQDKKFKGKIKYKSINSLTIKCVIDIGSTAISRKLIEENNLKCNMEIQIKARQADDKVFLVI